jgi:hypothetical protein
MGIVLFDRESSGTTKRVVSVSLSGKFLFDGYLTESYKMTEGSTFKPRTKSVPCSIEFFDVGKIWQLFCKQTEEIIYELKEALAA